MINPTQNNPKSKIKPISIYVEIIKRRKGEIHIGAGKYGTMWVESNKVTVRQYRHDLWIMTTTQDYAEEIGIANVENQVM